MFIKKIAILLFLSFSCFGLIQELEDSIATFGIQVPTLGSGVFTYYNVPIINDAGWFDTSSMQYNYGGDLTLPNWLYFNNDGDSPNYYDCILRKGSDGVLGFGVGSMGTPDSGSTIYLHGANSTNTGDIDFIPGVIGGVNVLGGSMTLFKSKTSGDADSIYGGFNYITADGDTGMRIRASSPIPGNTAMWLNVAGRNVVKLEYDTTTFNYTAKFDSNIVATSLPVSTDPLNMVVLDDGDTTLKTYPIGSIVADSINPHAPSHYPDSSDEVFNQFLNTTDSVNFADIWCHDKFYLGPNSFLGSLVVDSGITTSFANYKMWGGGACQLLIASETGSGIASGITLSAIDTTDFISREWSILNMGAVSNHDYRLYYGSFDTTHNPHDGDLRFSIDTLGNVGHYGNVDMNSNRITDMSPSVASGQAVEHDQYLAGLGAKTDTTRFLDTSAVHADTINKYKDHANGSNMNSASYTHLTAVNHTDLTDGGNTELHIHDLYVDTTTFLDTIADIRDTLAAKEPVIAAGSANEFWSWDKTWRNILVSYVVDLQDSLDARADSIHGPRHLLAGGDPIFDQDVNSSDSVNFTDIWCRSNFYLGLNNVLRSFVVDSGITTSFANYKMWSTAACQLLIASETGGGISSGITLSAIDTTSSVSREWSMLNMGIASAHEYRLYYGSFDAAHNPNDGSLRFAIDTLGDVDHYGNVDLNSHRVGGALPALTDDQYVTKGQSDDSLDAKEPVISPGSANEFWSWDKTWRDILVSYVDGLQDSLDARVDTATFLDTAAAKWPMEWSHKLGIPGTPAGAKGTLIKTDLDQDLTTDFMLQMRCFGGTGGVMLVADISIKAQGSGNPTFPQSGCLVVDKNGGYAPGGVDSVAAYDSLGVVWVWIKMNNIRSQLQQFELYSSDENIQIDSIYANYEKSTTITSYNIGVANAAIAGTPNTNRFAMWGNGAVLGHSAYQYIKTSGLVTDLIYTYFGTEGNTSYTRIDSNGVQIWYENELYYANDKDSLWHIGKLRIQGSAQIDDSVVTGGLHVTGTSQFDGSSTFDGNIYSYYIDNETTVESNIIAARNTIFTGSGATNSFLVDTTQAALLSAGDTVFKVNADSLTHTGDIVSGGMIKQTFETTGIGRQLFTIDGDSDVWDTLGQVGGGVYNWKIGYHGSTSGSDGNEYRVESGMGPYYQFDHDGNFEIDGGLTANSINLSTGIQFDNNSLLSVYDTVSFPCSLISGGSYRTSVTAKYTIIGNVATINIPSISGTVGVSQTTYLGTMPDEIIPDNNQIETIIISNDGAESIGKIIVSTNGRWYISNVGSSYLDDGDSGLGSYGLTISIVIN